jgi:uncharacterized protein
MQTILGTERPFVHTFKTARRYYALDVNTLEIVDLPALAYEILSCLEQGTGQEEMWQTLRGMGYSDAAIEAELGKIEDEMTDGAFFSAKRSNEIAFHCNEYIVDGIENRLNQLILKVTENCNMRCSYCVYSGKYAKRPKRSQKSMSWSVAKKAIDYFRSHSVINHSNPKERVPVISFYGGEPMLEFDLIEKCITYAEECYKPYPVHFLITTNGTLLTESVVDFVADSKTITLAISLDGPREIHDRYRKLANGEGTFDKIARNLRSIRNRHPEFYERALSFNLVYAPPVNWHRLSDFFCSTQWLPSIPRLFLADLNSDENSLLCEFTDQELTTLAPPPEFLQRYLNYANTSGERPKRHPVPLEEGLYGRAFHKTYARTRLARIFSTKMPVETYHPGSICIPGQRRFMVTHDGSFFMCEKVPEHDLFRIGNVENGIDVEKVQERVKDFTDLTAEDCRNCWTLRMCGCGCFKDIIDGGIMSDKKKKELCQKHRDRMHRELEYMCSILEENPDTLKHLDNLVLI